MNAFYNNLTEAINNVEKRDQITCSILREQGWIEIEMAYDHKKSKAMYDWLETYTIGDFYKGLYSNSFLFKEKKDATMFVLRWS